MFQKGEHREWHRLYDNKHLILKTLQLMFNLQLPLITQVLGFLAITTSCASFLCHKIPQVYLYVMNTYMLRVLCSC